MDIPWIVFLGADGAGKSTVIEGVTAELVKRGVNVEYRHWRPDLGADGAAVPNESPHAQVPRSRLMSLIKLAYLWQIWMRWAVRLKACVKSPPVVYLLDRFYGDLVCDPLRYRYSGSLRFAKTVFRSFPQPDLILFLDAPVDILLERKQEVPKEELGRVVGRYRQFALEEKACQVIDASQAAPKVIDACMTEIEAVISMMVTKG